MKTLSNKDIVLYALYILDGWRHRVHTEDIALKCYELAPSKFSWVKYPQYPDPAPTRFALEETQKAGLVKGETERKRSNKKIGGRMLTSSGVEWIRANQSRIEEYLGKHRPVGERLLGDRRLLELFKSAAFKKFAERGDKAEISEVEFVDSLICTLNTQAEVLKERLDGLHSKAEELRMEDVRNYVDYSRKRFASRLDTGEE